MVAEDTGNKVTNDVGGRTFRKSHDCMDLFFLSPAALRPTSDATRHDLPKQYESRNHTVFRKSVSITNEANSRAFVLLDCDSRNRTNVARTELSS